MSRIARMTLVFWRKAARAAEEPTWPVGPKMMVVIVSGVKLKFSRAVIDLPGIFDVPRINSY